MKYLSYLVCILALTAIPFTQCMRPKKIIKKNNRKRLYAKLEKLKDTLLDDTLNGNTEKVIENLSLLSRSLAKIKSEAKHAEFQTYKDGMSLLHYAAQEGHKPLVKHLIEEEGMDPRETNEFSESPLRLASANGHTNVVRYLVKEQDVPWRTEDINSSPLIAAIQNNHEQVVHRLLKHEECVICLEPMNSFGLDDIVVTSCCQQVMCRPDYGRLLETPNSLCPGCRQEDL